MLTIYMPNSTFQRCPNSPKPPLQLCVPHDRPLQEYLKWNFWIPKGNKPETQKSPSRCLFYHLDSKKGFKEGRWECYFNYKEQNCFRYSLDMRCTNRSHLAVVDWRDCEEANAAGGSLLVHCIWRK